MWWFLYGLVLGAAIIGPVFWVQDNGKDIDWYVWLLGALAILLGTLAVQHFLASHKEMESRAAWMGLVFMGIPALILAGVTSWQFMIS